MLKSLTQKNWGRVSGTRGFSHSVLRTLPQGGRRLRQGIHAEIWWRSGYNFNIRASGARYNECALMLDQAGLFSAVTSAFIIQVQSQLQSDPNEETAALLRVLIYKIDNTTFGGDAPTLPQWAGPPQAIVHVQCLQYASLAASLLAAFLAVLGKQWLARYDAIDLRGSAIERSQDRQRKLNGINHWFFHHVIESLPLMLQAALLLLACALSKYLWEINTTVAAVVVGVTSIGVLFYLFIVVVGTASVNCPYQTPVATLIRYSCRSAYSLFLRHSWVPRAFARWRDDFRPTTSSITWFDLTLPFPLLIALAVDIFNIVQLPFRMVKFALRWLGSSSVPDQFPDNGITKLDFHCASWILQTSSDITIKQLALKFLKEILLPSRLNSSINSALFVESFNVFINCFFLGHPDQIPIANGLEELAETSAMCVLLTYPSVSATEATPAVIRDVDHRYEKIFPDNRHWSLQSSPASVNALQGVLGGGWIGGDVDWRSYNPPMDELTTFSRTLGRLAQFKYRTRYPSIANWLIQFAIRFLSQKPLPPTSVVVDCLMLIATDLKCNIPDANNVEPDPRSMEWDARREVREANYKEAVERCVRVSTMITFANLPSGRGANRFSL